MSYLDTPSVPDPSTVSNRQLALRYGAIWAAGGILVSLIGFLTNTDASLPTTSGLIKAAYSIISFGVAIYAVAMAIKDDRDNQLGGFISLGRAVGLGAMTGLISGLISMVYMFLYTMVINPGFKEQMMDAITTSQRAQGLSDEQIEMASKFTGFFMNPAFLAMSQVLGGLIMGVIIGLIAGVIMKKDRPFGGA
jgi:hypothetical protein